MGKADILSFYIASKIYILSQTLLSFPQMEPGLDLSPGVS